MEFVEDMQGKSLRPSHSEDLACFSYPRMFSWNGAQGTISDGSMCNYIVIYKIFRLDESFDD